METDRENPTECGWNQMSLSPSLYSWRDMGSLANENSREAPSQRECHYNIPGSAQTYILCALQHTHTHTHAHTHTDAVSPAHTEMFTLQSVLNMHIQTDMSYSWICARWHIYIWARLSRAGLWFGVTGLMPLPSGHRRAESQRDRSEGREMPFIHCQPPMSQPFALFLVTFAGFSGGEVTFGLLHSWLCAHVTHTCCFTSTSCCQSRLSVFLTWINAEYLFNSPCCFSHVVNARRYFLSPWITGMFMYITNIHFYYQLTGWILSPLVGKLNYKLQFPRSQDDSIK